MEFKRLYTPMVQLMKNPRFLAGSAVVVLGVFVALVFPGPTGNGLEIGLRSSARAQETTKLRHYKFTDHLVLTEVVTHVYDNYVDPERIDAQAMLLSGLAALQRNVAPVIVKYTPGEPELTIQVHNASQTFQISDVKGPWDLDRRIGEIFAFLEPKLENESVELHRVEYAVVAGMLRTLDPHSVLLTPDVYEDMRTTTRGEFGGLGIVIGVRDEQLTVIQPMEGTPASRAGLQAGDKIVKIEDESTQNMPLTGAVDRLRGKPGTNVTIWITRPGKFSRPKKVELTRAIVQVRSVKHRMLSGGIGYVYISNFQGNTHSDLKEALESFHQRGLKGLVLDLREDPGGLLDQAVKVADTFLPSGTLVATASNDPNDREEKYASPEGTEPNYPMVVLVDGRSASASEIVAGALKAHDRALVVGQTTFGKGSVQVLYDLVDDSALKLTIAEYLTPGDVSIQEVGIVPDIALDPMTVDKEDMDVALTTTYQREADLRKHLTSAHVRAGEKPQVMLRYYLPTDTRRRIRENPQEETENRSEDEFLLKFAQELLQSAPDKAGRIQLLASSANAIERAGQSEDAKLTTELRKLGVNWAAANKNEGSTEFEVEAWTSSGSSKNEPVQAGEPYSLTVKVTNTGKNPVHRLRATTESDFGLFDERELVFGTIAPGKSREWTAQLGHCKDNEKKTKRECAIPRGTPSRADGIKIEFDEQFGRVPKPVTVRTEIKSAPEPNFTYSYQLLDDREGNGDGKLSQGEKATIYFKIKNVGPGPAMETRAFLRNESGSGILLKDGRFNLGRLDAGEDKLVKFTFDVLENIRKRDVELVMAAHDVDTRQSVAKEITVPIVPRSGGGGSAKLDLPPMSSEPKIEISNPPPTTTTHSAITIAGKASDKQAIKDVYIYVGSNKVFYKAAAKNAKSVDFRTTIQLKDGSNYVIVVARESDESIAQRTFVVRKDGPQGQLLDTPERHDEDDPWAMPLPDGRPDGKDEE